MTNINPTISITNSNDIALLKIATGAKFSLTTLPSGYTVPKAPPNMYYTPHFQDGKAYLVLVEKT
jgi:hypothetical protein